MAKEHCCSGRRGKEEHEARRHGVRQRGSLSGEDSGEGWSRVERIKFEGWVSVLTVRAWMIASKARLDVLLDGLPLPQAKADVRPFPVDPLLTFVLHRST